MIVPQNRLLLWFALLVVPFMLLGAIEPAAVMVSAGCIGAFCVVVLADGIMARTGLDGITVTLPEVIRLSKDREAKLELRLQNERQTRKQLRVALALPRAMESSQEDLQVELPAGSEWSRLLWPCVPRRRGSVVLEAVHVERISPLGFWAMRRRLAARCEVRVYPNLSSDRKTLAALFLNRSTLGLHAQRQLGKGREFEKLREYVPGDGYDEVHWKATARRGKPITKVFQIEKTQEIYVVIDASRLSARETVPSSKFQVPSWAEGGAELGAGNPEPGTSILEQYITAALMLGLAAEKQGDLFGLITFSDKVQKFVRAKNGKAHYSTCRESLFTLQPQVVSPDFDELCTFIRLRLRRRTMLFFLTSLDDPVLAESFVRNLDLIRRQHLVLVNMIQPPGVEPVFTNPNVATVDQLYQHLGGHLQWTKLRGLETVLKRRGMQFSLLGNERLSTELVAQYLNVKRRQLL
jgi:uncharacterized protein (DUF58 family)